MFGLRQVNNIFLQLEKRKDKQSISRNRNEKVIFKKPQREQYRKNTKLAQLIHDNFTPSRASWNRFDFVDDGTETLP